MASIWPRRVPQQREKIWRGSSKTGSPDWGLSEAVRARSTVLSPYPAEVERLWSGPKNITPPASRRRIQTTE